MELFTTVYCLFMISCFDTKTKPVPFLNYKDVDGKYLPCPKNCDCYRAPEDKFDMDYTSNSMVCTGERDDLFNRYFGSNDQTRPDIKLNTLVLNNLKLPFPDEVIVINAESLVIQNTNLNMRQHLNGNFRYLTMYDQKELESLPEMAYTNLGIETKLEEIYILNAKCKNEKDFELDNMKHSPKLHSFTLRQSCHQTISRQSTKLFAFSESLLRTIDLSGNQLINADAIVPKEKNIHLISLYLNDNNLISIPIGLVTKFPNLKTVHLYGNPIMILDFKEIAPLIGQTRECIIYNADKNSKELELYNTGKLMRWIPHKLQLKVTADLFLPGIKPQITVIKSVGTLDSLQHLNIICKDNQRIKYSPQFTFDSCPEWKEHPQSLYLNDQSFELQAEKQTVPILGKVIDYSEKDYQKLDDKQNTYWLRLSGPLTHADPVAEQNNYNLRNMLYLTQMKNQYFVFRFDDMENLNEQINEWNQMLIHALQQRPNVIGFELNLFDKNFADLSFGLDPLRERSRGDSGHCSLEFPKEDQKKRLTEKLRTFRMFQQSNKKIYERISNGEETIKISYAFLFTIDVKCLHLLNIFLQSAISECSADGWDGFDGITIVNVDKQDKDYEKQMKTIAEFRSKFDKLLFKEEHSGAKSPKIVSLISKQT